MKEITDFLEANKDLSYREFHRKLMPTVPGNRIIGVRVPVLRKYAKDIYGTATAELFMKELPHKYYEEDNIHAFLIERISDYEKCVEEIDRFLPFIDNWATCDMMSPKVFSNNKQKLLPKTDEWISTGDTYAVRFGILTLMRYFLKESMNKVAKIHNDDYYVKMMQAWFFATALTNEYESAVKCIEDKALDKWIHNKAIQKAIESKAVLPERKAYLRSLKIK